MQIYQSLNEFSLESKVSYAVTFGKFDGLHVGHQALLETFKAEAQKHGSQMLVISLLYSVDEAQRDWEVSTPYVCSRMERERALQAWGIDGLLYLRFDEIRTLSYKEFLTKLLEQIDITVLVGSDKFSIGARKQGKPKQIRAFLRERAAQNTDEVLSTCFTNSTTLLKCRNTILKSDFVTQNSLAQINQYAEKPLSTTFIKGFLETGAVDLATRLMWLPFSLSGKVAQGRGKGRELGYPTANFFNREPKVGLKQATYLTFVWFKRKVYPALTFVGTPIIREDPKTLNVSEKSEPIIESFVLDFTASMYNIEVEVYFLSFLRENIALDDYQDLRRHIENDEKRARAYFADKRYHDFLNVIKARIRKVHHF